MSSSGAGASSRRLAPASLNFLTIYCPNLGPTERTEQDQIVFYHTGEPPTRKKGKVVASQEDETIHRDLDEQLRQIGLAQGIVNFARTFSNNETVDCVETEKHRIVLTELEEGWWILASINLTRLPSSATSTTDSKINVSSEYSSREVSPPALLLQQLRRAYGILLLHHGRSLSDLYIRLKRLRFCNLIQQYWTPFARDWDVMLHGNPTLDVFGGIKLAAGGELGIGVGEEERGSGERAVLEDLIHCTEGLVDICVGKFGNAPTSNEVERHKSHNQTSDEVMAQQWLGGLEQPNPSDGLIFTGVGALSHDSVRNLFAWMQNVYTYGEDAYGVRDNPTGRSKRAKKDIEQVTDEQDPTFEQEIDQGRISADHSGAVETPKVPHDTAERSIVTVPLADTIENSLRKATVSADATQANKDELQVDHDVKAGSAFTDPDIWVKYLTLGASTWFTKGHQQTEVEKGQSMKHENPATKSDLKKDDGKVVSAGSTHPSEARFLIGLAGNLDEPTEDLVSDTASEYGMNDRKSLRTVHVEVKRRRAFRDDQDGDSTHSETSNNSIASRMLPNEVMENKRLRVFVYIHQPFIFTLLYDPNEASLSMTSFFHDLHRHLVTLHKPLLESTAAANAAERLQSRLDHLHKDNSVVRDKNPIFHLIYDPQALTIHSSIPNIPLPGTFAAEGFQDPVTKQASWTRVEALNVHSHILNTYSDTRHRIGERERTAKTSRGFWTVWMQVPAVLTQPSRSGELDSSEEQLSDYREAILVRRAVHATSTRNSSNNRNGNEGASGWTGWLSRESNVSGGESLMGGSSSRLGEGIGVDARKYVEGLLSLS